MTFFARRVENTVTLLIIGVMIGYVANAAIGVLKCFANDDDVREYVIWGLGSFSRVSGNAVTLFISVMAILLPLTFFMVKPMDLLLLGDSYARNLGLNIRRARALVILFSGAIVAVVTAYCGPILFIGLAVPHLCRGILQTGSHRLLVPNYSPHCSLVPLSRHLYHYGHVGICHRRMHCIHPNVSRPTHCQYRLMQIGLRVGTKGMLAAPLANQS